MKPRPHLLFSLLLVFLCLRPDLRAGMARGSSEDTAIVERADDSVPSAPRRPAPNVLMIIIDDLNDWVSPLGGHPFAETPNLDRLASEGVTFTNAHCPAPLCNPSRTAVMLGLRPDTTGIYALKPWFRTVPALASRTSLPQAFRQAGYTTASTGKVYHGVYTAEQAQAAEFDLWGPAPGVGVKPPEKIIPPTPNGNHPLMDWGAFPHADSDHGDYKITTWALEEMRSLSDNGPFFLCVGYALPHVPLYVTPERLARVPDCEAVLPPILKDDREDTPRFSWYLHWSVPEPRLSWLRSHDQWRPLCRAYLAATTFVDEQIGRLLDGLEALGLREDTWVVLWSDNGYHLGEKGISGKNTLWTHSTRVPFIISGPGIAAGRKCEEPVGLIDIFPTLADLTPIQAPTDLDGVSLLPQLLKPETPRDRPAITTANPSNFSLCDRRWRYIRYADGSEELYDRASDPREWHNLAASDASQAILAAFRAALPTTSAPPAPGSARRLLTYDPQTDTATWEQQTIINRTTPIP